MTLTMLTRLKDELVGLYGEDQIAVFLTTTARKRVDDWSIDVLPQRKGEHNQPCAHGFGVLARRIGSSKKLGEGHRVVGNGFPEVHDEEPDTDG